MKNQNHKLQSDAERVAESGLFDADFYLATYGDHITKASSPIDHFLKEGLAKGYLPSEKFDPVLYRMLNPECGQSNPVVHFLDHCNGCIAPSIDVILPDFRPIVDRYARGSAFEIKGKQSILMRIAKKIWRYFPQNSSKSKVDMSPDVERNRAYATRMAQPRSMDFQVGEQRYSLKVPPAEFFLDRLQSDAPFAFVRLPHGFWEALITRGKIERALDADPRTKNLSAIETTALATRIGMALLPFHGGFAEEFTNEMLRDISNNAGHPDFFRSIAFKGYPTWDEKIFPPRFSDNEQKERLVIMSRFFKPHQPMYDAALLKRYLIAGDLKELPALCRRRHVILVASDIFSELDQRWNLERFTHICIPRALSQKHRWDLLERIKKAIDNVVEQSGLRPIILTQCGGALAFWLISRLFKYQSDVFYIDLGQALNGWFFDSKDLNEHAWTKLYKHSVIKNCSLESYYLNLGCKELDSEI